MKESSDSFIHLFNNPVVENCEVNVNNNANNK